MGYHKLLILRSYRELGDASVSVNYRAKVTKGIDIKSNLYFSNNEETLPEENPDHDRAFKV